MTETNQADASSSSGSTDGVPIFLRKTYHMIDSCDPTIACWSEDGETFVVKDPTKFERTVIPQFFKHSKFSSFVRQLNFYAFRKIKYADTIRIDPQLEAETANYWRFRHEKFRRGRPDLLIEIKRMNGQKGVKSTTATAEPQQGEDDNTELKSQVNTLKKRIEAMTKNIDELTSLVEKVSLKQEEQEQAATTTVFLGNKRKKFDETFAARADIRPDDVASSSMEMDEVVSMPTVPSSPQCLPDPLEDDDNEFVDQIFNGFGSEEEGFVWDEPLLETSYPVGNHPDPELMKRLSDALSLLPRDIQELIVDRLIAAITSTDAFVDKGSSATPITSDVADSPIDIVPSLETPAAEVPVSPQPTPKQVTIPLAAATLAALLAHYNNNSNSSKTSAPSKAPSKTTKLQKSLPVIPVHA